MCRNDDERVRTLVRDDVPDGRMASTPAQDQRHVALLLGRRPCGCFGLSSSRVDGENFQQPRGQIRRVCVVNGLNPGLRAAPRQVDCGDQTKHPTNLGTGIGDDQHVARGVRGEVSRSRHESREQAGDIFGGRVFQEVDSCDETIRSGDCASVFVERERLPLCLRRFDNLEIPARWHDRESVHLQDRQERLVCLRHRHLGRSKHGRLECAKLRRQDEAPPGHVRDQPNQVGERCFLEIEGHAGSR